MNLTSLVNSMSMYPIRSQLERKRNVHTRVTFKSSANAEHIGSDSDGSLVKIPQQSQPQINNQNRVL